jgi:hypothetical protein
VVLDHLHAVCGHDHYKLQAFLTIGSLHTLIQAARVVLLKARKYVLDSTEIHLRVIGNRVPASLIRRNCAIEVAGCGGAQSHGYDRWVRRYELASERQAEADRTHTCGALGVNHNRTRIVGPSVLPGSNVCLLERGDVTTVVKNCRS